MHSIQLTKSYLFIYDLNENFIFRDHADENKKYLVEYQLYGIICHHGESIESGHYTAFIKDDNDNWFLCDDERISKEDIIQIVKKYARNMYVIVYKKMN